MARRYGSSKIAGKCLNAASRRPDYELRRGRNITAAKNVHAIKTPIAM